MVMEEKPDMTENQNFYIIEHGVHWTGMPAWGNTLSDEEIWKLVTFLSQMGKLPPSAEPAWQQSTPSGQEEGNSGKESTPHE